MQKTQAPIVQVRQLTFTRPFRHLACMDLHNFCLCPSSCDKHRAGFLARGMTKLTRKRRMVKTIILATRPRQAAWTLSAISHSRSLRSLFAFNAASAALLVDASMQRLRKTKSLGVISHVLAIKINVLRHFSAHLPKSDVFSKRSVSRARGALKPTFCCLISQHAYKSLGAITTCTPCGQSRSVATITRMWCGYFRRVNKSRVVNSHAA